jgi:hypothetical protein
MEFELSMQHHFLYVFGVLVNLLFSRIKAYALSRTVGALNFFTLFTVFTCCFQQGSSLGT